jgi:hypothetical protein
MAQQAAVEGAKLHPIRHLVRSTVGVPADVCGIDRDQAIHQAQREAADAALGEIGLEHRRAECHLPTADGDRSAELEADRFEDLLV